MRRIAAITASTVTAAAAAVVLLAVALPAAAQVTVTDPWARATVAGQKATGAFMQLTSATNAALVDVASPVAKIVEIHEMKMDAGVMKMAAVAKLPLPAGKPVELAPGGYHVMLMDLARPLKEGETIPLTLTVADATGKTQKIEVRASVRALTVAPAAPRGR
jgi:periplasmic copper chaperone A